MRESIEMESNNDSSRKLGIKRVKITKNKPKRLKGMKVPKLSDIKPISNSRRDSIKELNRYYSKLLSEHKKNSEQLVGELLRLIGDQYRLHIRQKHSTRILQACLKYGNDEQRQYIYQKIKGKKLHDKIYYLINLDEIPYLCMSNHGSHLAIKAYRYCNSEAKRHFEDSIIYSASSIGYIKSRFGSLIWDFIYNKFITTKQIGTLLRILIPNSIKLLQPELYERLMRIKNLNQLYNNIIKDDDLQLKIKEKCLNLFGKLIDKSLTNTSISHDIGYLSCLLSNDDELIDLSERFTQGLDSLYMTKSGVYVASYLYGYTSPKGRKMIVKQMKQNLYDLCTNAATYLFVARVLLMTDDTKLTIEHMIKPIGGMVDRLSFDRYGHKIIACISNSDSLTLYNGYEREVIQLPSPKSLKEFDLRHTQLQEALLPLLYKEISHGKLDVWLTDRYASSVVESAFSRFNFDLYKSIVNTIGKFDNSLGLLDTSTCLHLIQRIVKKLPNEFKESACDYIWEALAPRLNLILSSRSVFLLIAILETLDQKSSIFKTILNKISIEQISKLKSNNSSNCGLEILEKIINQK